MVANDLVRPNGLASNPNSSILYVSDTGYITGKVDAALPRTIYAYDVSDPQQTFLQNRRVFAYCDTGIPDGLKVDNANNVWAGCGDGLNVWNAKGQLIGKILIKGGVSNFVFTASPKISLIVILNEYRILSTALN